MKEKDVARFLSKIRVAPSGCWEYTGHLRKGYGIFSLEGKSKQAHRVMYELMRDEILSSDVELDHLCKNHPCVNPDHVEKVSGKVNTLRGMGPTAVNARKTHCINGHELTVENTYVRPDDGARDCRACAKAQQDKYRNKKK